MDIIEESVKDGVVQRRFDLVVEDQKVPGLHWLPEGPEQPAATILMGHGGLQSKEAPNIIGLARKLARERGYATIALDAPGHGERRTPEQIKQQEDFLRQIQAGREEGDTRLPRPPARGLPDDPAPDGSARQPRMVREWKALLDHLGEDPATSGGPYGYWGVSMGTRYGIPLVASEPRIACAVLGLFGAIDNEQFMAQAQAITVPLLFLFQYHDELMTPEAGLEIWNAFGSQEKTMHINPGPHVGVPLFERDASSAFYARHLK